MIGDKKRTSSGQTIEFTKVNPTTTFKAMRRELQKRGYQTADVAIAKTGSHYFTMDNEDESIAVEVRSSNHSYVNMQGGISLQYFTALSSFTLNIDLAKTDMNVEAFRVLVDALTSAVESGDLERTQNNSEIIVALENHGVYADIAKRIKIF